MAGAKTTRTQDERARAAALRRGETASWAVDQLAGCEGVSGAVLYLPSPSGRWRERARAPEGHAGLRRLGDLVRRAARSGAPAARDRVVAVPLGDPPEPAGVALVELEGPGGSLPPPAAELLEVVAVLLENERRLDVLGAEARRDPLTGALNRRAFDERVASAANRRFAIVFCDLDGFKRINLEHGYQAGDEVLREVARVLAGSLRRGEELYRIGGDEFAVVVGGSGAAAEAVARRLEDAAVRQRRGRALPPVSTGIARSTGGTDPEELVALAAADLAVRRLEPRREPRRRPPDRLRVLVVDDDPALRLLLRTTFEAAHVAVHEAATLDEARAALARQPLDVVVLDVSLSGEDGLELARELKGSPHTAGLGVVLLTGGAIDEGAAGAAGADALLRKPFSPLDLLARVERLAGASPSRPLGTSAAEGADDQLLLYAGDLRRLLDLERRQHAALERAYRETIDALASALEIRDSGTGAHSLRVQAYATEIARAFAVDLLDDPSVEYGFLLHDIGKIGVPDEVLQKRGKLDEREWALMRTHAPVGAQILEGVGLLRGEGLSVVRHHHERWDGRGYPDGLAGERIPLGARVFAVADALDAITSDRPYRDARPWREAVAELRGQAGTQFDPDIVEAFLDQEPELRRIRRELVSA